MAIKSKEAKPERRIELDLTGPDGNAFVLLGTAKKIHHELKRLKVPVFNRETDLTVSWEEVESEMTAGDYEHLVNTMEKYYGDYIIMYR